MGVSSIYNYGILYRFRNGNGMTGLSVKEWNGNCHEGFNLGLLGGCINSWSWSARQRS